VWPIRLEMATVLGDGNRHVIRQLRRNDLPNEADDSSVAAPRAVLTELLCAADARVLARRQAEIKSIPGLETDAWNVIAERIYLLGAPLDECWTDLEEFCAAANGAESPKAARVNRGFALIEALAGGGPEYVKKAICILRRKLPREGRVSTKDGRITGLPRSVVRERIAGRPRMTASMSFLCAFAALRLCAGTQKRNKTSGNKLSVYSKPAISSVPSLDQPGPGRLGPCLEGSIASRRRRPFRGVVPGVSPRRAPR